MFLRELLNICYNFTLSLDGRLQTGEVGLPFSPQNVPSGLHKLKKKKKLSLEKLEISLKKFISVLHQLEQIEKWSHAGLGFPGVTGVAGAHSHCPWVLPVPPCYPRSSVSTETCYKCRFSGPAPNQLIQSLRVRGCLEICILISPPGRLTRCHIFKWDKNQQNCPVSHGMYGHLNFFFWWFPG